MLAPCFLRASASTCHHAGPRVLRASSILRSPARGSRRIEPFNWRASSPPTQFGAATWYVHGRKIDEEAIPLSGVALGARV